MPRPQCCDLAFPIVFDRRVLLFTIYNTSTRHRIKLLNEKTCLTALFSHLRKILRFCIISLLIKLHVHFSSQSRTELFNFHILIHFVITWHAENLRSFLERYFFHVVRSTNIARRSPDRLSGPWDFELHESCVPWPWPSSQSCNSLSNSLCFPSRVVWRTRKTSFCNKLNLLFVIRLNNVARFWKLSSLDYITFMSSILKQIQNNNYLGYIIKISNYANYLCVTMCFSIIRY